MLLSPHVDRQGWHFPTGSPDTDVPAVVDIARRMRSVTRS